MKGEGGEEEGERREGGRGRRRGKGRKKGGRRKGEGREGYEEKRREEEDRERETGRSEVFSPGLTRDSAGRGRTGPSLAFLRLTSASPSFSAFRFSCKWPPLLRSCTFTGSASACHLLPCTGPKTRFLGDAGDQAGSSFTLTCSAKEKRASSSGRKVTFEREEVILLPWVDRSPEFLAPPLPPLSRADVVN